MIIKKILVRKDGVKYLTIPKNNPITGGDFVAIEKLKFIKENEVANS